MHFECFIYSVGRTFVMKMTMMAKRAAIYGSASITLATAFFHGPASLQAVPPSSSKPASPTPSPVVEGRDGWLFLESELRFLSFPTFWGKYAVQTSRSPKSEVADPLPAIVDFNRQLAKRGIALFLVPVPPKAWNASHAPGRALEGRASDALGAFYKLLAAEGVRVVDLRPSFAAREEAGEAMYCKTDSHWSGAGCVTAAVAVAKELAQAGMPVSQSSLRAQWTQTHVRGDLLELKHSPAAEGEIVPVRQIGDAPLLPNPASSLVLIGDSHTLVYHDFLAERAGFPDQLAKETGIVPDWIGTRGSGTNAVRISLLRRAIKEPAYLESKKAVIWCFAAREFTEADQGWQLLPLTIEKSSK